MAITVVAGAIAVGWVVVRFAMPGQGRKKQGPRSEDGGSGGVDYVGDNGQGGDHGWLSGHGHSGDHGGGDAGGSDGGGSGSGD